MSQGGKGHDWVGLIRAEIEKGRVALRKRVDDTLRTALRTLTQEWNGACQRLEAENRSTTRELTELNARVDAITTRLDTFETSLEYVKESVDILSAANGDTP